MGLSKNTSGSGYNPMQFTGEYYEDSGGLLYLRARYYDPNTGRFITADSYTGELTDPLSQNTYVYCGNNPIAYTNPSGHLSMCEFRELENQSNNLINYQYTDMCLQVFVGPGKVWGYVIDNEGNWYSYEGWGLGTPGASAGTVAPIKKVSKIESGWYYAEDASVLGLTWNQSKSLEDCLRFDYVDDTDAVGGSFGSDLGCGACVYIYYIEPCEPPLFWDW